MKSPSGNICLPAETHNRNKEPNELENRKLALSFCKNYLYSIVEYKGVIFQIFGALKTKILGRTPSPTL